MKARASNSPGAGLEEYNQALARLVSGDPIVVPKGQKITMNSVALEAGKSLGSIKKSRSVYAQLIRDIEAAAEAQVPRPSSTPSNSQLQRGRARFYRDEARRFEKLYKASLARELMLLAQLDEIQGQLRKYSNVIEFPNG